MSERLHHLISGLLDENLSDAETAELSELLERDGDARREYMVQVALHAELRRQASDELDPDSFSPALPLEALPAGRPEVRVRRVLVILGAAAALVVAGVLLRSLAPGVGGSADTGIPAIATLTGSSDGRLVAVASGRRVLESERLPVGFYELSAGIVELTMATGTTTTVEGPAAFVIAGAGLIRLERGKLAAHVPEAGHGFTVELPDATVVDLGTRFGVEVLPDGSSELHVFQGVVQLVPKSGAPTMLVHANEAARMQLEKSKPVPIQMDPNLFVRQLQEPESDYSRLVLSLDPMIYLPMVPSRDGRTLYDISGNENHGSARNISDLKHMWSHGRIGGGIRFDGTTFRGFAGIDDYPKTTTNQLSVAAWVRVDAYTKWASIAKNWAGPEHGQFHFGLYEGTGRLEVHVDDNGAEIFAVDPEPLPLAVWQHVAFVADGSTLHLYRNGIQVASASYRTIATRSDIKALILGNKIRSTPPANSTEQYWNGRLDEFALFNRAVPEAAIRALYEAGTRWDDEKDVQVDMPPKLEPAH